MNTSAACESNGYKRRRLSTGATSPPTAVAAHGSAHTLVVDDYELSHAGASAPAASATSSLCLARDVRSSGDSPSLGDGSVPLFVFDEMLQLVGEEHWLSMAAVCRSWRALVRRRFKEMPEFERSDLVAMWMKRWTVWFGDGHKVDRFDEKRLRQRLRHTFSHRLTREDERDERDRDRLGDFAYFDAPVLSHLESDVRERRVEESNVVLTMLLRCVELRHFRCVCYLLSQMQPYNRERARHIVIARTSLLCWPHWAPKRGPDASVQTALPIARAIFGDFAMTDAQALHLVHDALLAGDMALVRWAEGSRSQSYRNSPQSEMFETWQRDYFSSIILDVGDQNRGQWCEAICWLCERNDVTLDGRVTAAQNMFLHAGLFSTDVAGVKLIKWLRKYDPNYLPDDDDLDNLVYQTCDYNRVDLLQYVYEWVPRIRERLIPGDALFYAFQGNSVDMLRWLRLTAGFSWSSLEEEHRRGTLLRVLTDLDVEGYPYVSTLILLIDEYGLRGDDPHLCGVLVDTPVDVTLIRQVLTSKLGIQFDEKNEAIM